MTQPSEIVFGQGGGRDLRLDLFEAHGEARAVILMVHGGGWRRGSRAGIASYGAVFAGLGFTAIAAEYRLLDEAPWPAQLDDVETAVAWAAAHAKRLGKPLAVLGFSAGGHLALLAADDCKDKIAAVIALFAPVELVADPSGPGQTDAAKLLADPSDAVAAHGASPLHRAGPDFPPAFLLHGGDDCIVSPLASQRMFDALTAAGATAELHIYAGHAHEFAEAPYMMQAVAAEVATFLHRTVIDPAGARLQDEAHNPFARGGA